MTKIPVGATIAHAYRFAFGSFVKIFAVVWMTWVIATALGFLMMRPMLQLLAPGATPDPVAIGHSFIMIVPFYLLVLVLLMVQFAGLTRLALGLPMPSSYFYFSLGKPVWRLMGAFLLILLIFAGCGAGAGIVIGLLGATAALVARAGEVMATEILGLVASVTALVVYCALIYGMVRLTFLLNPVVIAEERIGLKRAWQLGKGNFWRAFVVLLALFLPLMALELAWLFGPWGPGLMPTLPPHPTPEQTAAFQAAVAQWMNQFSHIFMDGWYITGPAFLLITILFYGAMCGAQAFAYRAVTEGVEAS